MGISGKCDFEDTCCIYGEQNIIDKYDVFVGDHTIIPLKIETPKDLVAYYPYLTTMISYNGARGTIYLTNRSYIDQEEEEWLSRRLKDLVGYYKKCKRKQEPFDKDKALEMVTLFPHNPEKYQTELVNRVVEEGEKATIHGLHDSMHERMRKEWCELMIECGWEDYQAKKWVYGWERYFLDGARKVGDIT
mgnify:CR=1 FL=1